VSSRFSWLYLWATASTLAQAEVIYTCEENGHKTFRSSPCKTAEAVVGAHEMDRYAGLGAQRGSSPPSSGGHYPPRTLPGLVAGLAIASREEARLRKERELALKERQAADAAKIEQERLRLEEKRLALEIARERRLYQPAPKPKKKKPHTVIY
jgi:hypothetical protein